MPPLGLCQVQEIENHISTSGCHHPPLKDLVYHGCYDGTTPLLLACKYGDLKAVEHIIESWGVDPRATAVYYMDSGGRVVTQHILGWEDGPREPQWIKIDEASPLFVAASNGHVEIVRYLLQKGANLATETICASHVLYNGLTPLDGAFYIFDDKAKTPLILRLLLEAGADPNTLSFLLKYTTDFEAATLLINHGLDLTQRDWDSAHFILHHWVSVPPGGVTEEQSLSVVKLLVDKGADLLARDNLGSTPILHSAKFLNLSILDYLLERDGVPRMDKIDALELAGARILSYSGYASLRPKAFDYWRRALQLRQLENEEGGPFIKTPLKFEHVKTVEWVTADELEDVIQHPSKHLVHSFLLQLRIATSCEPCLAVDRLLSYSSSKPYEINQPDRFAYNLDILWATMETIRPKSSELSDWTHCTTEGLVTILSFFQRYHPLLLTVDVMKISLQLISDTYDNYLAAHGSILTPNLLCNLLRFIELLVRLPHILEERITPGDRKGGTIRDILKKLIQRDRRDQYGKKLLYLACLLISSLPNDDRVETIRLLLDSGADPNAVYGADGNAPLHVLARFDGELVDAAANLLLKNGAHFDRVNKSGKTALDVWMERHEGANGWKDRPSWCRPSNPPSLMCQCARVIRANKVPYNKEPLILPVSLHPFVELH